MLYYLQLFFLLFFMFCACAKDHNLVIIVDNLEQETAKTDEINMTHQCITALQQRASMVLISGGLWKNIVVRKKNFSKQLEDVDSLATQIFKLYTTTQKELQQSHYNFGLINKKLSASWFAANFPLLAELSQDVFNQLRFDFACYIFAFDMNSWQVYNAHTGMLLFVPKELNYVLENRYQIFDEQDLLKHAEKKSNVVQSLELLLPVAKTDRFVLYLTGHGHPKESKHDANIAGISIDEFKKFLLYLQHNLSVKLLVYSSCFGGGVHTIEPYGDIQLHYPVIVTAATDAPIFGFGLFEGVKLPPYDTQFKLESEDISKKTGLAPCAFQNYKAFFKRAWKGYFDLSLVQLISRFFTCDFLQCQVQKIENFPLIRKAYDTIFLPMKDGILFKLVQPIMQNGSYTIHKPTLLYCKKIKKFKMDKIFPIVSMIPGVASHEITELIAPFVNLSALIEQTFLSLEDVQPYKNFIIKNLVCIDDITDKNNKQEERLSSVLVLGQKSLMPKFLKKDADALIYFQKNKSDYLLLCKEHTCQEVMQLDKDQIKDMQTIINFVQQSIAFNEPFSFVDFLTHAGYVENKEFQQELVESCLKVKVCKK
ncbi:MAG: hypothetical protein ACXWL2_00350 [Candidatus Chromulinivorax sp.]